MYLSFAQKIAQTCGACKQTPASPYIQTDVSQRCNNSKGDNAMCTRLSCKVQIGESCNGKFGPNVPEQQYFLICDPGQQNMDLRLLTICHCLHRCPRLKLSNNSCDHMNSSTFKHIEEFHQLI